MSDSPASPRTAGLRLPVAPPGRGYAVAVLGWGVALGTRLALDPILGDERPFALFFLAVLAAAWAGGRRPALLAVTLGALAAVWLFVPPRGSLAIASPGDATALLVFVLVGVAAAEFTERHWAARAAVDRLNEALRRQAEELRAVVEALPVGVFIADDPACTVIRANRAGNNMLGIGPGTNASKTAPTAGQLPFRILRDGVEVPADELPMQQAVRTGRPVVGEEIDVVRADGTAVRLYEYAIPLFDPAGRVRGCVGTFVDLTALRRAEGELRESERLLRIITDAVPALISYVGADGRYRLVNGTYGRWFDRPLAEFPGRHMREVLGDRSWADVRPHVERALAGADVTFEFTLPEGVETRGPRTVRVSYTPDRGPDGRVRGLVILVNDLSDRIRAEQAVRQNEVRFRALMEQAPLSIQVLAPDGRTLRVNRAWEELWGLSLEQLADYNVLLDPQLEARGITPYLRRGFAGEATDIPAIRYDPDETLPGRARHPDPARWVRAFIYPLRDDRGRIFEVVLIHEDITAQRRAAEAVRASEERYRTIFESAGVSLWEEDFTAARAFIDDLLAGGVTDLRRHLADRPERVTECAGLVRVRDVNAYTLPMFGAARKEELTASLDAVFLPETLCMFAEEMAALAEGRRSLETETVMRTVRGERIDVWVSVTFPEPGAAYDRVLVSRVDITARKRAERLLREQDRLKDEYLAMLAHELRNPLAPIRNALFVLKKPAADPAVREAARATAERQVAHMARLLDDLLDVSRISRGKIELRREPVDLAALLGRTVEAARPLLDERRHALTVALPPAPVVVDADPTRLEQVVTNLLANAAKYTDPGGRVWLSAGLSGAENGSAPEVVIRVRDTGIGIDPDMLPRVFDLFVQAERRVDRSRGGVGIGLTLVKRLVEMHGGTVEAHSPGPGQGSEFVVRLPVARGAHPRVRADEPRAVPPPEPRPARRVLVVDDNVDAADSLAVLLRLDGCEARVAYDGPAALAAAPDFRPEAVFLDLGMPGMDGWEVCRRLRALPELAGARFVAVTGWGQEADRRRSAEAGFAAHLVKPADPDAVRAAVG